MRKLSIPKFLIVNLCSVCVELMHLTVTAFFFLREGKKNYEFSHKVVESITVFLSRCQENGGGGILVMDLKIALSDLF